MSGVGYCEAGLVTALARFYPENEYTFAYFTLRNGDKKLARLTPYLGKNAKAESAHFSPFLYRAMTNFIPVPYRWFFKNGAQVTHFFNYIAPPYVGGKSVVTVHDMVIRAFPETVRLRTKLLLQLGLKRSMKRADRIVTDSEFSKQEIIKYYPKYADKVRVVYCGVNTERFHPVEHPEAIQAVKQRLGIQGDYFLYLGTLEPRKNLERLIQAYKSFLERNPNPNQNPPRLVLSGGKGWLYEGIFETVQALGLQEQVMFTQYIPAEELCPLMAGALAFVFPSLYEGFGMPPLEAMACGTPVLCSTAASLPEVVGDCAVLVDPYNTEQIAAGLSRLWTDSALRAQLRQKGLQRVQQFTWDAAAKQLYRVYEELCV